MPAMQARAAPTNQTTRITRLTSTPAMPAKAGFSLTARIERPIVVTQNGVLLCRPSERVLEILENPEIGTFVKEDGEVVPPKGDQAG